MVSNVLPCPYNSARNIRYESCPRLSRSLFYKAFLGSVISQGENKRDKYPNKNKNEMVAPTYEGGAKKQFIHFKK